MIWVIYGGAGSGKSAFGEKLAVSLGSGVKKLLYVATMKNLGEATGLIITKHKKMRQGKGFETLEIEKGLSVEHLAGFEVVMLECVSNWVANEMFDGGDLENIRKFILSIKDTDKDFIIITNDIFGEGYTDSPTVTKYMKSFGEVNLALAEVADVFIEVRAGVCLCLKGGEIYAEYC